MTKLKEFKAKDEDELLDSVILWPESDKEWDRGWEWIDPNRIKIKDMFKYEKKASLEIRLDCEHIVKCYLDFGDGSPIITVDDFSITKKDDSSIFKADVSHLYSKKMKYTVKLKIETTCPQEDSKTEIADVGLRNLVVIKKVKAPLELINKKVRHLLESFMKNKGSIIRGVAEIKFFSHIRDPRYAEVVK